MTHHVAVMCVFTFIHLSMKLYPSFHVELKSYICKFWCLLFEYNHMVFERVDICSLYSGKVHCYTLQIITPQYLHINVWEDSYAFFKRSLWHVYYDIVPHFCQVEFVWLCGLMNGVVFIFSINVWLVSAGITGSEIAGWDSRSIGDRNVYHHHIWEIRATWGFDTCLCIWCIVIVGCYFSGALLLPHPWVSWDDWHWLSLYFAIINAMLTYWFGGCVCVNVIADLTFAYLHLCN